MNKRQLISLESALDIVLDVRNNKADICNHLKNLPRTEDVKSELIAYRMAIKSLEAKLDNYKRIVEQLKK